MMAMFNVIQGCIQLAFQTSGYVLTKEVGYFISGQAGQSDFAGAFEQTVNGKVAVEDHVAAEFNLGNEIIPVQIHDLPFFLGKLRR